MIKAIEPINNTRNCFSACPTNVVKMGQCVCNNQLHNRLRSNIPYDEISKMLEVVVYLDKDQKSSRILWVNSDLSKEEITNEVDKQIGPKSWHAYDIQ